MNPIRLACAYCDRTDMDGITDAQLEECTAAGWTDITPFQTYEQSMITHPNPDDAPTGFDTTAWYTHLGVCPDCQEED